MCIDGDASVDASVARERRWEVADDENVQGRRRVDGDVVLDADQGERGTRLHTQAERDARQVDGFRVAASQLSNLDGAGAVEVDAGDDVFDAKDVFRRR